MTFDSAWDWAGSLPSAPPGNVCAQCHDCRQLYEPIAERVIRALEMNAPRRLAGVGPSFVPPAVADAQTLLQAKLDRLKRISGLYARSFQILDRMGVRVPFVGTAAFTSNLVGHELKAQFDGTLALHPAWSHPDQMQGLPRSPFGLGPVTGMVVRSPLFGRFWSTIHQVFDGNAVVFVEIFAIVDFFIRHLERFGRPEPDKIPEFEECLRTFINWWDEVQPSHRRVPEMADIQVDRNDLILQGLMACLQGNALPGSLDILQNEQEFTLQEYMYDLIQGTVIDEMELGLLRSGYNVASRFAYDLDRTDVPERYTLPYRGGGILGWNWITEYGDRIGYARQVVTLFDTLYYGNDADRAYLRGEHNRLASDASGY